MSFVSRWFVVGAGMNHDLERLSESNRKGNNSSDKSDKSECCICEIDDG